MSLNVLIVVMFFNICVFSCVWSSAAGLAEPQICYVLDGILFLYGIILTALYCRIKVCMRQLSFFKCISQILFYKEPICKNRIWDNGNERPDVSWLKVIWYIINVLVKRSFICKDKKHLTSIYYHMLIYWHMAFFSVIFIFYIFWGVCQNIF